MLGGYRIAVVALGLSVSLALGQTQNPSDGPERQESQQEEPTQTLPIPLPVQIIEDDATAQARERSEGEARQREIDDLAAQQGMNAATQAMNEATQRMANDSREMTIATWIGVALLFVTLFLTLQANRAASRAVSIATATLTHQDEMMQRQLRAYIEISEAVIPDDSKSRVDGFKASIRFQNFGATPAKKVQYRRREKTIPREWLPALDRRLEGALESPDFSTGPGAGFQYTVDNVIEDTDIADAMAGRKVIIAFGDVRYEDVFGNPRVTEYCLEVVNFGTDRARMNPVARYGKST